MRKTCLCVLWAMALGCGGVKRYDGPRPPVPPRMLPPDSIWYQDVSAAPVDAESVSVIAGLASRGGFGSDGRIIIDFRLEVLTADDTAPMLPFMPARGFFEPDCDLMPVPVPAGGALEAEPGYTCFGQGDCHLIVQHLPSNRLYEMWHADLTNGFFTGGCLAVWDLGMVYGPAGRGHNCTSADAAGFPIAPLLFTSDEVASGEIPHAIRFILPNDRIRRGAYVSPATHSTEQAAGAVDTPPYGARLRLRADFPVDKLPEGPRVIARALQRYGMFLADGGNDALTGRSDRFSSIKWNGPDGLLVAPDDLGSLRISDFEMVDAGPRFPYTDECVREPAPAP
jgi:serine/threonine-protein kinase